MDTEKVAFHHVTTYMPPLAKRVIGIAVDPSNPQDVYAAVEVGGPLASRDRGGSWESMTDGLYVRNNTVDLHGVQVSSDAPGIVFIVTQVAMFLTRDKGHRWEHVRVKDMFPGGAYCRSLLIAPDDPRTMYLAASAGGGGAPAGTRGLCSEVATWLRRGTRSMWARTLPAGCSTYVSTVPLRPMSTRLAMTEGSTPAKMGATAGVKARCPSRPREIAMFTRLPAVE